MTYPTSINMTFDTSLVDLGSNEYKSGYPSNANHSFSTTESDTISDTTSDRLEATQAPQPTSTTPSLTSSINPTSQNTLSPGATPTPTHKPCEPIQHVETQNAYDQWAGVYDTDGNMLQAIDDVELSTLLPSFLTSILTSILSEQSSPVATLKIVDLGCGTGRNTSKLISYRWPETIDVRITGLDFSKGMLEVAASKVSIARDASPAQNVEFELYQCDCFPTASSPSALPHPSVYSDSGSELWPVNAVISTLVLEHVPLPAYFATLSSILKPGGYALVTNMHSEMGQKSQAGFVNKEGIKVRGKSFAHTPEETLDEAQKAGLKIVGKLKERRMEAQDVDSGVVGERGRKWVGVLVWYAIVVTKVSQT